MNANPRRFKTGHLSAFTGGLNVFRSRLGCPGQSRLGGRRIDWGNPDYFSADLPLGSGSVTSSIVDGAAG